MEGFKNWEFMIIYCWGERVVGDWVFGVYDIFFQLRNFKILGKLKEWFLVFYGIFVQLYLLINEFFKVEWFCYS